MNQLATLLPVPEQALAGTVQGAAVPRGAPPDPAVFAMALGEQLWTLPASEQAGGASPLTAPEADGAAGTGSVDPAALLQDLLAEITRLAIDSAGGEEMLAGRIVSALREVLSSVSKDGQPQEVNLPAAQQAAAAPLRASLGAVLQQLNSSENQPGPGLQQSRNPGLATDKPGNAPHQGGTQSGQLAPLIIQALERVLAELQASQPGAKFSAQIAVASGQGETDASKVRATQATAPVGAQTQPVAGKADQTNSLTTIGFYESGERISGKPDQLLQIGQRASSPSPSVEWFNALGNSRSTAPPAAAGTSLQVSADTLLPPTQATQAPAVQLVDTQLELPGSAPLQLQVQALRGSGLDPVQRIDVLLSDPTGESEDIKVSMALSTLRPERLIPAAEMQRVAATLQRVLDGTSADAPDRSVALMDQTAASGKSIPEAENAAPPVQSIIRSTAPSIEQDAVVDRLREQRLGSLPEAEAAFMAQDQSTAAELSRLLGRRRLEQTMPTGQDLTVTGAMVQQTLEHPVPGQSNQAQSISGIDGQLMLHPQAVRVLPDQLLQFSAPAAGSGVSGYALDEIQQQLMERVRDLRKAGDGLYNIKLDLYPKELGRMIVNIAIRGSNVAMQMAVVNQDPRPELKRSLAELKKSLEDEGLSVVDLRVISLGDKEGRGSGSGSKSTSDGAGS
jgi:hypothetical protein